MALSKYYYNPETCRYEPKKTAYGSLLGYAILFAASTFVIFAGILFLHSRLFLTERGKQLKKENKAMEKYYASLQQETQALETSIGELKDKNASLHVKLFESPLEQEQAVASPKADLLLADTETFREELENLETTASSIKRTAVSHNAEIASYSIREHDKVFLLSVPSIQPLKISEDTKLVSGFGMRINPFHKGNYQHPGVDFTAARGTEVLATANGRVIRAVKGSTLQAGYGNYVDIEHSNGLTTRYAHLDEVTVKVGQNVRKGITIGTVGMSGGSVAPHVHYEIIRNNTQVDPLPYMLEGLSSDQHTELQKLGAKMNQSLD
ncbi:MAG TPA: M23 family metallopeptidase [Cyclobacteriaceae bacterium]|nr:M23 family metallopeptidase [Cyclobacteriaceae bacterium]